MWDCCGVDLERCCCCRPLFGHPLLFRNSWGGVRRCIFERRDHGVKFVSTLPVMEFDDDWKLFLFPGPSHMVWGSRFSVWGISRCCVLDIILFSVILYSIYPLCNCKIQMFHCLIMKFQPISLFQANIIWAFCFFHFGFTLFRYFLGIPFFNSFVWQRVTEDGSVPEMRIWSILLIQSDLVWSMHLGKSIFLYLTNEITFTMLIQIMHRINVNNFVCVNQLLCNCNSVCKNFKLDLRQGTFYALCKIKEKIVSNLRKLFCISSSNYSIDFVFPLYVYVRIWIKST